VWSDTRTKELVLDCIERVGGVDRLREKTGLPISTYFSAVKFQWMYQNIPEVKVCFNLKFRHKKQACEAGSCLFGTVDTWILWNLTGGAQGGTHLTDITNASRTLLCDIKTLAWDKDLLE
jgi:glycerol kinase